jgi:hypothetical protein
MTFWRQISSQTKLARLSERCAVPRPPSFKELRKELGHRSKEAAAFASPAAAAGDSHLR